jgi:hypothetical protein
MRIETHSDHNSMVHLQSSNGQRLGFYRDAEGKDVDDVLGKRDGQNIERMEHDYPYNKTNDALQKNTNALIRTISMLRICVKSNFSAGFVAISGMPSLYSESGNDTNHVPVEVDPNFHLEPREQDKIFCEKCARGILLGYLWIFEPPNTGCVDWLLSPLEDKSNSGNTSDEIS